MFHVEQNRPRTSLEKPPLGVQRESLYCFSAYHCEDVGAAVQFAPI
jgi:hypothetical protein